MCGYDGDLLRRVSPSGELAWRRNLVIAGGWRGGVAGYYTVYYKQHQSDLDMEARKHGSSRSRKAPEAGYNTQDPASMECHRKSPEISTTSPRSQGKCPDFLTGKVGGGNPHPGDPRHLDPHPAISMVMVWWADAGLKILPLVALAPARRRESELKPPAAASKLRSRVPMQKVLPGRWAQVRRGTPNPTTGPPILFRNLQVTCNAEYLTPAGYGWLWRCVVPRLGHRQKVLRSARRS